MLDPHTNALLEAAREAPVDLSELAAPTVCRRPARRSAKREIRAARRFRSAAEAVGPLAKNVEVYGLTRCAFSVIDILTHCLAQTGPARLDIWTWTAGEADVTAVLAMLEAGRITAVRWLIDKSFQRRHPATAQRIQHLFGNDAIRIGRNHAKFYLLGNDAWHLFLQTSMNLNPNPRFEGFHLRNDPELYAFHARLFDDVFAPARAIRDTKNPLALPQVDLDNL